jgi:phytoene/squalene synthetase
MSIQEDYRFCKEIIRTNSKSFFRAFSKLPEEKANAVYAVYAFCRYVDDIVDGKNEELSLKSFITQFEKFKKGQAADHPLWRALEDVFIKFPMSFTPFEEMIEGQLMDESFKQPQSQEDLEKYCYYVAGTVGLMILPILSKYPEQLKNTAVKLGTAMQLTNILRDIGEDYSIGRVYIPVEVLNKFNYEQHELSSKVINHNFIELWEYEAKRAESLYKEAMEYFYLFDKDSLHSVVIALFFYKEILNSVRKNRYDCLSCRNYVSMPRKYILLIKSYLARKRFNSYKEYYNKKSSGIAG